MFKGGPLLPYDFSVVEFSKKEKKTWDWYIHLTTVATAIFDERMYGFSRVHTFFEVLPAGIESKCNRGSWIEDDSALYMNKEALRFYA